jgi:hypothetical protein
MSWWQSAGAGLRRFTRRASMLETPRYIIFDLEDDTDEIMFSGAVNQPEADYLRDVVLPRLRPLSEEDYFNGPLAIYGTAARFSYVLAGSDVYWCVEWDPGLLVIRFSADGSMSWCSLRSPVPNFGGREATEEELDAYDEDEPNPQYNLVFDAWDPQLEPELRDDGWAEVSADERRRWKAAMAQQERLGATVDALAENDPEAYERWRVHCQESPIWKGTVEH